MLDKQKLGTIELVTGESVERSAPLYFVYMVGRFFGSKWFRLISAVLVITLAAFFVLSVVHSRRRRMRGRKRPKYSKKKGRGSGRQDVPPAEMTARKKSGKKNRM
jgi:ABC-type nickel/cobalt efflux system permease component RcnA